MRRRLLRVLFAVSLSPADAVAVEVDLYRKGLVVRRAAFAREHVFQLLLGIALDDLLQLGLMILERQFVQVLFGAADEPQHKALCRLHAAVEVNRRDHRLERVGQNRRPLAPAGVHFALAK